MTNDLLSQAALDASANTIPPSEYPWADGRGTQTIVPDSGGTGTAAGSASSSGSGSAASTGTTAGSSIATGTETSSSSSAATSTPYFGDPKPDATPGDGLGAGTVLKPILSLQALIAGILVLLVCVWDIA